MRHAIQNYKFSHHVHHVGSFTLCRFDNWPFCTFLCQCSLVLTALRSRLIPEDDIPSPSNRPANDCSQFEWHFDKSNLLILWPASSCLEVWRDRETGPIFAHHQQISIGLITGYANTTFAIGLIVGWWWWLRRANIRPLIWCWFWWGFPTTFIPKIDWLIYVRAWPRSVGDLFSSTLCRR